MGLEWRVFCVYVLLNAGEINAHNSNDNDDIDNFNWNCSIKVSRRAMWLQ